METIILKLFTVAEGVSEHLNFALILRATEMPSKHLPIVINSTEAENINHLINDSDDHYLHTYNLLFDSITALEAELAHVLIYKFERGIFYTKLVLKRTDNQNYVEVESKISDAIAFAHLAQVPILTYKSIMDKTSVTIDDLMEEVIEDIEHVDIKNNKIIEKIELDTDFIAAFQEEVNKEEYEDELELLEGLLGFAVEQEEYKIAAQLQKLITTYKR